MLHNLRGDQAALLWDGILGPGTQHLAGDKSIAPGVYLVRVECGNRVWTDKIVNVR
jgi:hypothetical protein